MHNMMKVKHVYIIVLYQDNEFYRNLKNTIAFVCHVRENMYGSSMVMRGQESLKFYSHNPTVCLLPSQSKIAVSKHSSHQICNPGGWVKKQWRKGKSFFLISLIAVPHKTFPDNLSYWHMASSRNIQEYWEIFFPNILSSASRNIGKMLGLWLQFLVRAHT